MLVNMATFWRQFVALMKRNLLLKKRNKNSTLQEFLFPVFFIVFLGVLRISMSPHQEPEVTYFPEYSLEYYLPYSDILISPDTTFTRTLAHNLTLAMRGTFNNSLFFETALDLEKYYKDNITNNRIFIGLDFMEVNQTYVDYALRFSSTSVPKTRTLFGSQGTCRNPDGYHNCPADSYLYSGFIQLQKTIDTLLIQHFTGNTSYESPTLQRQQMPKSAWVSATTSFQAFTAIYLVIAYSVFVIFMLIAIVTEKEKKIKDVMCLMGLKPSALWLSWMVTYAIVITVVTVIITFLAWVIKLYKHSNMFYILLLLLLYGYSIITFSFMLAPFFKKAELAGAVGSGMTTLFSLAYLGVSLTRTNNISPDASVSKVPIPVQWLMSLFSPIAFALGIDQSLHLDISAGGVHGNNLWLGEFPVAASFIMLAVDCVLYGLLALYLDNVIPDQYGQRMSPLFCFKPSYWRQQSHSEARMANVLNPDVMATSEPGNDPDLGNVESVPGELAQKNVIRICNVRKTFAGKNKNAADALNGVSLDIYEGQITAILGHNGAGKTTLINIMTGLVPPSSGHVFIYNMCATDGSSRGNISALLGVCPQYNILLSELTSEEHLQFFAAIKNVPQNEIPNMVNQVLREVDLMEQKNVQARKLSGGQQRKLSLALALIGDPKVLLLDEPTAGLDPLSRHHIWSILKDRCRDRVVLLATHFMDEADILADRKAFLSRGSLKYVGSSLFLKNRFGVGYHVGLVVDPDTDQNHLTTLIQSHIPNISLNRVSACELTCTVPLHNVDKFPQLLNAIEDAIKDRSHGIQTYGVSMTTLEEVFLKIGIDEEVEDSDKECSTLLSPGSGYQNLANSYANDGHISVENPEDDDNLRSTVKHVSLLQFTALCKVRVTHLFRNKSSFVFRVIMPVLFVLLGVIIIMYITPSSIDSQPLALEAKIYVNTSMSRENSNFVYLLSETAVGQNWEAFVKKLEQFDVSASRIFNVTSLLSVEPHHLGTTIHNLSRNQLTIIYNDTAIHSLPIGLNLLSNILAAMSMADRAPIIRTSSNPWPAQDLTTVEYVSIGAAVLIGLAIVNVPASLAMLLVRERENNICSQLRLSGVSYMMYWMSAFCSDIVQLLAVALSIIIIILCFQVKSLVTGGAMLCLCLVYLLYLPVNLLLAYTMTFFFKTFEQAQNVMYNVYFVVAVIPSMVVSFTDLAGYTSIATGCHYAFCAVFPPYVFVGLIYYINKVFMLFVINEGPKVPIPVSTYFTWDSNIPFIFIPPFIQIPLFIMLICYLETRSICCTKKRSQVKKGVTAVKYRVSEEDAQGEDSDVEEERNRVKLLMQEQLPSGITESNHSTAPAIIVDSVSKVYVTNKSHFPCSSKEPRIKCAVQNLSFCINRGEVFGLLGPNGAGKTTSINMITAQTAPSRGKILVSDVSVDASVPYKQLGYCPQHDALYSDITLTEHLDLYAALCGYNNRMRHAIINYYSQLLQLGDHLNKRVCKLSGGTKRKLSYCMAMIGRPSVVLLDEPSTGLDPKSKHRLWDGINRTFAQSNKAAILTTHYMEEADALCTRLAIMINGQMVCLGSVQHLKNKYGSGYMLEVKLSQSDERRTDALHQYITTLIPGAERIEYFQERAIYRISQSAVCSVAKIFESLQQNKEKLHIEDYSFSQSTLEQVFLRFARRQAEATDTDDIIDLSASRQNLVAVHDTNV